MNNKTALSDGDRKAWAAYVVGHHAHTLRLRQEMRWTIVTWPAPAAGEEMDGVGFGAELDEMRRAVRVLAVADRVRASVQVELHRALDQLASVFRSMPKSQQTSGADVPSPPGLDDWREVVALADCLLAPFPEQTWSQLGALVGRCRLLLRQQPETDRDGLAKEMSGLPGMVEELCAGQKHPFLRELLALAGAVPRSKRRSQTVDPDDASLYLAFARLDLQVLSALQQQEAPEPLLVLDRDKLVLLGETLELANCSQNQVACLWVLAERAGAAVPRKTILEEGKIVVGGKANGLKTIVSRLRSKILRPLIERHRRRHGGRALPAEDMAFILARDGKKRHAYQWGVYQLHLDAERVRVIGPRPRWMNPAGHTRHGTG